MPSPLWLSKDMAMGFRIVIFLLRSGVGLSPTSTIFMNSGLFKSVRCQKRSPNSNLYLHLQFLRFRLIFRNFPATAGKFCLNLKRKGETITTQPFFERVSQVNTSFFSVLLQIWNFPNFVQMINFGNLLVLFWFFSDFQWEMILI